MLFRSMGANIGTCSDGIMASIGTNANGKRVAFFHAMTSTIGAVAFSIILTIFRTPIIGTFERLFENPSWSLAVYNLAYNFIYTLILLAFLDPLVNFVTKTIKDKPSHEKPVYSIDERLLRSPSIAISQALKEVSKMALMAKENLDRAFDGVVQRDMSQSKKIATEEYKIDELTRVLADFFIKISSITTSARDEHLLGGLHHVINDIERIGDHAVLFAKETNGMIQYDVTFPEETNDELKDIYLKISAMFILSLKAFETRTSGNLKKISTLHREIIDLISDARDEHIKRLNAGMYSVEVSKNLYAVLLSLQRISDHIVNIAFSISSATGSKVEAFSNLENKPAPRGNTPRK